MGHELGVGVVWWPPLDALCRADEGDAAVRGPATEAVGATQAAMEKAGCTLKS